MHRNYQKILKFLQQKIERMQLKASSSCPQNIRNRQIFLKQVFKQKFRSNYVWNAFC